MNNLPIETIAMVHSLNARAEVTITEKVGDNDYRANYNGKICTAIFNPFVGMFYVDDVYGIVKEVE